MGTKIIHNPTIARQLLKMGNKIIDIKPKRGDELKSVFVFEWTDKLGQDLTTITKR